MDKTIVSFGFINITYYAFFIVMGMILGIVIVTNNKKIKEINLNNKDLIYDYFFWLMIFSFIGARTWYVLFAPNGYYFYHLGEIIAIWNGGLAIHGGIIGGTLYTWYFCKNNKINLFELGDAIAPALLLGQALGRWGNFVNQEAYGTPTSYEFLKYTLHLPEFICQGMKIDGVYYQPTFLYESIWNLIGFVLLFVILRKLVNKYAGFGIAFYLVWYGFIRFFIEQMRQDALIFFGIKIAEFTSFIFIIIGITLFTKIFYKQKQK